MKTITVKSNQIRRKWYLVDAENKVLGRMATEIAKRLHGKHKPEYTPNMDLGDYIIVINAAKVKVTGNKEQDKIYFSHTGYPGGARRVTFEKMIERKPELVIERAVKGMLPKGPLGRQMFKKLKVYGGAEHHHAAQQPEILEIKAE